MMRLVKGLNELEASDNPGYPMEIYMEYVIPIQPALDNVQGLLDSI
jgi:hypothetical protein